MIYRSQQAEVGEEGSKEEGGEEGDVKPEHAAFRERLQDVLQAERVNRGSARRPEPAQE